MYLVPPPRKIAGANIRAARLLCYSTVLDKAIEGVGITVPFIGVSANRTKYPPGSFEQASLTSGTLAETGDAVDYRGPGQEADVLTGAAITSLVLPVTSDGSGRAITASVATVGVGYFAGMPLQTANAANEIIRMLVQPGFSNIGAS